MNTEVRTQLKELLRENMDNEGFLKAFSNDLSSFQAQTIEATENLNRDTSLNEEEQTNLQHDITIAPLENPDSTQQNSEGLLSASSGTSSQVQINAGKGLIAVSYAFHEDGVVIVVNTKQRHATHLAGMAQGDHAFAHSAMVGVIIRMINGKRLNDTSLREFDEFAKKTMTEEEFKTYKESVMEEDLSGSEFRKDLKKIIEKRDIIHITSAVKHQEFKANDFEKLCDDAIRGKINVRAAKLSNAINRYLKTKQQSGQNISYSKGRINKKKNEDILVPNAINALAALDFIEQVLNTTDQQVQDSLLNEMTNDEDLRNGLNILCKEINKWKINKKYSADGLIRILNKESNDSRKTLNSFKLMISKKYGDDISKLSAKYVNDLFDFPKELIFNLNSNKSKQYGCAISMGDIEELKKKNTKEDKERFIIDKMIKHFENEIDYEEDADEAVKADRLNRSFDFKYKSGKKQFVVSRNNQDSYYERFKNAYASIIEGYPNLFLKEEAKQTLLKKFARLTLTEQGWCYVIQGDENQKIETVSKAVNELLNTDQQRISRQRL